MTTITRNVQTTHRKIEKVQNIWETLSEKIQPKISTCQNATLPYSRYRYQKDGQRSALL